ncbi:uncharacterized protein LOC101455165 [Ceratitis capitata]|uniref:(Mediterranean fruit fly) hypothetical protein n=1 Tax=Ceratitis capitata TaxID=7213 RepID=A0A811UW96_CERCA|nr:uncharacterized protein LOC101455165 [Ceratitis capitata]CAD7002598.1 unnamed protein product [Ceratitis capitata]
MQHNTRQISILLLIIAAATLLVQQSVAKCGVCGDNGIACISETEFYICFNGEPDTSTVQECPDGGTCTSLLAKCINAANTEPDCSSDANPTCGCYFGSTMFVCTSRTTFAQCNGNETIVSGTCPTGMYCTTQGGEICIEECKIEGELECDIAAST